jgi:Na+/H+ antiporter NhaD/arsenite permease-like protein
MMKPSHILRLVAHERTALLLVFIAASACVIWGVPLEFVLFGATLAGVALFHRHTLQVALIGLAGIALYKFFGPGFKTGAGLQGLGLQLANEWVVLTNLLGLLLGFALLSRHFEESGIPKAIPRFLPGDWKGAFVLLVMIFVLSSFLDNIAAAIIGGTIANTVFRRRVHIGYVAAIVAAANAGGSGSVIGDTTTTMMWIDGVDPVDVLEAFVAAGMALVLFGIPAALQQQRHSPLTRELSQSFLIDWPRIAIVGIILTAAIVTNVVVNLRFALVADAFPFLGAAVWLAIVATASWRDPDWRVVPGALKGSLFLLALILCASFMPVERLPAASWQTALGLGFVSAVFDNIPLTALALKQGGYDWGYLAYAVGFGGSMIWFGSSAGVAICNLFPQGKSVGLWLKHGWHVAVAYVLGFAALFATLGWHPNAPHKEPLPTAAASAQGAFEASRGVQFGPMEAVLLVAGLVLILAMIYKAGGRKESFVRESSRGLFLRELNAKLEVRQERPSPARTARIQNVASALVVMAVIALADSQTRVSLWPLYLGPVIYLSWLSGFTLGAITAFLAGVLLVTAVVFSGHPYSENLFFVLSTLSHVVAFLVVAWLANRAAAAQSRGTNGA